MKANTIIMAVIFVVLFGVVWYSKGFGEAGEGLKQGGIMLKKIWLLLIIAFGVAGMIQVLVPKELVSEYLGTSAGYKGILIAWLIGSIIPGAPYVILPLCASLLARGAGIGPIVSMVLASSLIGVTRIPYEIAFIGWQFSLVRVIGGILLPPLAGSIVVAVNKFLKIYPL
jgi:uncharacterized membrane protein YraQ (UPF0718 family)